METSFNQRVQKKENVVQQVDNIFRSRTGGGVLKLRNKLIYERDFIDSHRNRIASIFISFYVLGSDCCASASYSRVSMSSEERRGLKYSRNIRQKAGNVSERGEKSLLSHPISDLRLGRDNGKENVRTR